MASAVDGWLAVLVEKDIICWFGLQSSFVNEGEGCIWLELCFVGGSVEHLSVSSGVVDDSGFGGSFPLVELVRELILELGSRARWRQ